MALFSYRLLEREHISQVHLSLGIDRRRGPERSGPTNYQKNPRVHKIFVRNSGAGNGCANFMGTWKNCDLSAGKPMPMKFLVFGGGGKCWVLGGGGSADFILWARGFF